MKRPAICPPSCVPTRPAAARSSAAASSTSTPSDRHRFRQCWEPDFGPQRIEYPLNGRTSSVPQPSASTCRSGTPTHEPRVPWEAAGSQASTTWRRSNSRTTGGAFAGRSSLVIEPASTASASTHPSRRHHRRCRVSQSAEPASAPLSDSRPTTTACSRQHGWSLTIDAHSWSRSITWTRPSLRASPPPSQRPPT